MPIETRPWDIFEFLTDEEAIAAYVEAAREDGNEEEIKDAIATAEEARRRCGLMPG